jgi:acid stress-induced BolA-like protein IbaG/YrbA
MMTADKITSLMQQAFPNADIKVVGDDGVHFQARIISEQFSGLSPIARHRLVYASLGDAMDAAIHALSLETLTPAECV